MSVLSEASTSIKFNTYIKKCLHQRIPWHYRAGSPGPTEDHLLWSLTGKHGEGEEWVEDDQEGKDGNCLSLRGILEVRAKTEMKYASVFTDL